MKARVKATGEIAEFITGKNLQGETILLKVGTASIFSLNEVEPIADIDWQHYRIKAAIAIVQGWASTPQGLTKNCMKGAVELADALVAKLKGGQDENG